MSDKNITETEFEENFDEEELEETLPADVKNYMTPFGLTSLQDELQNLFKNERPKICEIVNWAAGNGDRSENGDYIYGKKRLREIDRRIRYLTKRLESAELVDPAKQQKLEKIFFGATVTYIREDDTEHKVTLVGPDEADLSQGKISWISPVAKALMKAEVGDEVKLRTEFGAEILEVVAVSYNITG